MRAERQHACGANTVCFSSVNLFPKLSDFWLKIGQFCKVIKALPSLFIVQFFLSHFSSENETRKVLRKSTGSIRPRFRVSFLTIEGKDATGELWK